jgi:predicted TIM-barrel fold metal-dependent hydrolase
MMIVDMRLRPPYKSFIGCQIYRGAPYYPTRMGFPRPPSADSQSVELMLEEMEKAGIDIGVIPGRAGTSMGTVANDDILEFVQSHSKRFVWLAGLDTGNSAGALAEIERVRQMPAMCGFAIEPALGTPAKFADDDSLSPIYDACQSLGLPISISQSALMGPDLRYSSPIPIQRVAKKFPKLTIIVAHAGWPYVMEVLGVAFACPNVVVSPDLYMNGPEMPGASEYIRAAGVYLGERLLFGTAYPSRPLVESVAAFERWELESSLKGQILAKNAIRILNIKVPA